MSREWTYIGRCDCGVIDAARVDDPEREKETRKFVGRMIDAGLLVKRVRTEDARSDPDFLADCRCRERSVQRDQAIHSPTARPS